VGVFLVGIGIRNAGPILWFIGLVVTVLAAVSAVTMGSRGQIIALALYFLFMYLVVNRAVGVLLLSISLIITVGISYNAMTFVRADTGYRDVGMEQKLSAMISELGRGRNEGDLLAALEYRFGEASRRSVAFLRLVAAGKSAGLAVIKSALWAPLPRRFFPDKPLLGSVDGTKEGMGMHVIHWTMDGTANMSEFYTGVHAYWELGIAGVVCLSAFSALFIFACIKIFASCGTAALPLMMVALKPPWLEPKLWTSEAISDAIKTLAPLLIVWCVMSALNRLSSPASAANELRPYTR
jgi:hypothetical protein